MFQSLVFVYYEKQKYKREGLTLSGSLDEAFPGSWPERGQPEPPTLVSLALEVSEKTLRTTLKDR